MSVRALAAWVLRLKDLRWINSAAFGAAPDSRKAELTAVVQSARSTVSGSDASSR